MSKEKNIRQALKDYKDNPEFLIDIIVKQAEQIDQLLKQVEELKKELEVERRKNKRQAAPFGLPEQKRKQVKKTPGRKRGHDGSYRQPSGPIEDQQEVELPGRCPHCGSDAIDPIDSYQQIIEELPELKPRVIELTLHRGCCRSCGEAVHSTHPLQTSQAQGAAKVQLGPRAIATALQLQHRFGLTKGKATQMFNELFNLPITKGGLINLNYRVADSWKNAYKALIAQAQLADQLNVDETSWYVSNRWQLWVLANEQLTLYHLSPSRKREVLENLLGKDFQGVLTSDCLNIYDDFCEVQQKCYAHHLKEISLQIASHPQPNNPYLLRVKELLEKAMKLAKDKDQMPEEEFIQTRKQLEQQADELFSDQARDDPIEQKINNRIFKQRKHLFTFLYHDGIDPTNNLAERQLRPAVIHRKLSCGNRTEKGAEAWQVNASMVQTLTQRGLDLNQSINDALKFRFHGR